MEKFFSAAAVVFFAAVLIYVAVFMPKLRKQLSAEAFTVEDIKDGIVVIADANVFVQGHIGMNGDREVFELTEANRQYFYEQYNSDLLKTVTTDEGIAFVCLADSDIKDSSVAKVIEMKKAELSGEEVQEDKPVEDVTVSVIELDDVKVLVYDEAFCVMNDMFGSRLPAGADTEVVVAYKGTFEDTDFYEVYDQTNEVLYLLSRCDGKSSIKKV